MKEHNIIEQTKNTFRLFNIEDGRHNWKFNKINKNKYSMIYNNKVFAVLDAKNKTLDINGKSYDISGSNPYQSFLRDDNIIQIQYNFLPFVSEYAITNGGNIGDLERLKYYYSEEIWNSNLGIQQHQENNENIQTQPQQKENGSTANQSQLVENINQESDQNINEENGGEDINKEADNLSDLMDQQQQINNNQNDVPNHTEEQINKNQNNTETKEPKNDNSTPDGNQVDKNKDDNNTRDPKKFINNFSNLIDKKISLVSSDFYSAEEDLESYSAEYNDSEVYVRADQF